MKIGILACSVFEPELEKVLSDIENKKLFEDNIKVTYLHFGLHTNLDKLEKESVVYLNDLVEYLNTSESTIRRDLIALDKAGL